MISADFATIIDHTLLRPEATGKDVERLCEEAVRFGFHSVCVAPFFVPLARDIVSGGDVSISTVVGFPHGATFTRVKVFEALEAVLRGSDELDIVMNVGMAREGRWDVVAREIADVIAATRDAVHKIIIEVCLLSRSEKMKAAAIVRDAGAAYVKTSTGFCRGGATVEDVMLIRSVVGDTCGIKASGGIRTLAQVRELLNAGATRIGTSAGVSLMEELSKGSRHGAGESM